MRFIILKKPAYFIHKRISIIFLYYFITQYPKNQPIKNTPYIFLKNFFDFLKKEANMA